MIRYGIVISLDEMFEIEAKKRRMKKNEFMMELLIDNLGDYTDKEKKKIIDKAKEDMISQLWEHGVMDDLKSLFFTPLDFLITSNDPEYYIFIGVSEGNNEDIMVPFSLIGQTIPLIERTRVNNILIEKGYGLYKPDFWLGITETDKTPYKSNKKLP